MSTLPSFATQCDSMGVIFLLLTSQAHSHCNTAKQCHLRKPVRNAAKTEDRKPAKAHDVESMRTYDKEDSLRRNAVSPLCPESFIHLSIEQQ